MTAHDPALVETVAEALCGDHQWSTGGEGMRNLWRGAAHTALDAITTSPRHELIELPEPSEWVGDDSWPQWNNYPFVRVEAGDEDEDIVLGTNQENTPYRINPTEARHVAAALLAAARLARAAESGSTGEVQS